MQLSYGFGSHKWNQILVGHFRSFGMKGFVWYLQGTIIISTFDLFYCLRWSIRCFEEQYCTCSTTQNDCIFQWKGIGYWIKQKTSAIDIVQTVEFYLWEEKKFRLAEKRDSEKFISLCLWPGESPHTQCSGGLTVSQPTVDRWHDGTVDIEVNNPVYKVQLQPSFYTSV